MNVTLFTRFFFKIKALNYSQPKGALPTLDQPNYCHTPPARPAPHAGNHSIRFCRKE